MSAAGEADVGSGPDLGHVRVPREPSIGVPHHGEVSASVANIGSNDGNNYLVLAGSLAIEPCEEDPANNSDLEVELMMEQEEAEERARLQAREDVLTTSSGQDEGVGGQEARLLRAENTVAAEVSTPSNSDNRKVKNRGWRKVIKYGKVETRVEGQARNKFVVKRPRSTFEEPIVSGGEEDDWYWFGNRPPIAHTSGDEASCPLDQEAQRDKHQKVLQELAYSTWRERKWVHHRCRMCHAMVPHCPFGLKEHMTKVHQCSLRTYHRAFVVHRMCYKVMASRAKGVGPVGETIATEVRRSSKAGEMPGSVGESREEAVREGATGSCPNSAINIE